MAITVIKTPDIGADSAEIIEILVSVGDQVELDQSLLVLETDKASVEVPCNVAGVVKNIMVKVGDSIGEGHSIIEVESELEEVAEAVTEDKSAEVTTSIAEETASEPVAAVVETKSFKVPDLGSDSAEIIEISVAEGEDIAEGDTLVVVETDKASVEVPAEASGKIVKLHVKQGQSITLGEVLIDIETEGAAAQLDAPTKAPTKTEPLPKVELAVPEKTKTAPVTQSASSEAYAGPATRKLARQMGIDLDQVPATGQRGRILKDDLLAFVKNNLSSGISSNGASGIPAIPPVDWQKFGSVNVSDMSKIQQITAANMTRNWLNVPHVTQFDQADVTDLEAYRAFLKAESKARGIKMTPLAFILKACAIALKENPKFNTAIHENGKQWVQRDYIHIALAVDTPRGLLVPVIKDVDQKDIWQIADDVSKFAGQAKAGKLSPADMQGGCFTVSSLGAIGGTGFTPIVSAPQTGILGVSKTSIQPVWNGSEFTPRNMMPLSLSYDHNAVNGVDGGLFLTALVTALGSLDMIWNG